ncbi:MAG: 50S ribosomal protein L6 [Candidatus Fermentibacteraceae bacterium]|nr:50S ribosomal protein L6 [Candidatus Fermentibacteraceae bacterium]
MSRIGRLPIPLPDKVTLSEKKKLLTVKGPRGEMTLQIPAGIKVKTEDASVIVSAKEDSKEIKMLHGTTRAHLANRIQGVSTGHSKTLIVQGKGFQAEIKGRMLEMQLGFSHKVLFEIPDNLVLEVKPGQNSFTLTVTGNDKQLVGAFSSELYKVKSVEPYNLIGFRYSDQHVRRKAAKTIT